MITSQTRDGPSVYVHIRTQYSAANVLYITTKCVAHGPLGQLENVPVTLQDVVVVDIHY